MKKIRLDIGGPKGNAFEIMATVRRLCGDADEAKNICSEMRGELFAQIQPGAPANNYEDLLRVYLKYFPYVELYSTYELPIDPELYTLDENPEIIEL